MWVTITGMVRDASRMEEQVNSQYLASGAWSHGTCVFLSTSEDVQHVMR